MPQPTVLEEFLIKLDVRGPDSAQLRDVEAGLESIRLGIASLLVCEDRCIMMLRLLLRYRTLKLRALCWVLRRLRAGQRGWRDEGGIQISP